MGFFIILPTRYKTIKQIRYKLFLKTVEECLKQNFITKVIVVNTSSLPINISDDKIIIIEEKDKTKLKGDSIRTGIKYVQDHYGEDNIIAFQEPEKVSMIQEYPRLIQGMNQKCILVPKRSEHSWSSYPVEQYHSEHFMNMYLTNITNDLFIDWSFGQFYLQEM